MHTRVSKIDGVFICALVLSMSACSSQKSSPPGSTAAPAAPAAPPPLALWGDLKPIATVKELMRDFIDPLADNIFDSVRTVTTKRGTEERVPKTEEDWAKLRTGAVAMVEGANLLKLARPFANPGEDSTDQAAKDSELTTAEITAKREKDPVEWNARVEALRNVGLEVLEIIKKKDPKELWDASDNLDSACENCHRSFWYPKENDEFYRKLDSRLSALPKPSQSRK
jgi:hypothetical protein